MIPRGLEEIKAYYGDPTKFIGPDGGISKTWELKILSYMRLPAPLPLGWLPDREVDRIRSHYKVCGSLEAIFKRIHSEGQWDKVKTFDGCYAWRPKRSGKKLSLHSWGAAIDLNAETNQMGSAGDMDPFIVECFEDGGWEWGGRWAYPDPMHFQAAKGY